VPASIRDTMSNVLRRLLACAVSLAVMGAPVAAGVCEAACAQHRADSLHKDHTALHAHHQRVGSPHEGAATEDHASAGASIGVPARHVCDRDDAVVAASFERLRASVFSALGSAAVTPIAAAAVRSSAAADKRRGPPAPVSPRSQLRV